MGSIGTSGGFFNIGSGDTGLLFVPSGDNIIPSNPTNTANGGRDAAINLGNTYNRFKDAYFSGTVNATSFSGDGSGLTGVGASTALGAVGTYGLLTYNDHTTMNAGATKAGSLLKYNNVVGTNSTVSGTTSPAGTWRIMGYAGPDDNNHSTSVFVRIS